MSIQDKTVTMAHGAGGHQTSELIDKVFAAHFANDDLTADDAAVLVPPKRKNGCIYRWIYCISCIFSGRKYWQTFYLRNSQRSGMYGSKTSVSYLCFCD